MIIDSHAHYSHGSFENSFRYLTVTPEGYEVAEGTREDLFRALNTAGIAWSIEPGISLDSNRRILELCGDYPLFPAVGVHPTRCFREKWSQRKRLKEFAADPRVIAIGETGLDYHYERKDQHRLWQTAWFLYQLNLAWKRKLPVILHIREADEDALRILKCHPARKYGGVVHCFDRGWDVAEQYLKLGYHIGLGGAVLQQEERADRLWEAVKRIPLDRILLETDAPYILPYCKDVIKPKILRRTRNTSLILPKVAEKIGELKGVPAGQVEAAAAENTVRLFSLKIGQDFP